MRRRIYELLYNSSRVTICIWRLARRRANLESSYPSLYWKKISFEHFPFKFKCLAHQANMHIVCNKLHEQKHLIGNIYKSHVASVCTIPFSGVCAIPFSDMYTIPFFSLCIIPFSFGMCIVPSFEFPGMCAPFTPSPKMLIPLCPFGVDRSHPLFLDWWTCQVWEIWTGQEKGQSH